MSEQTPTPESAPEPTFEALDNPEVKAKLEKVKQKLGLTTAPAPADDIEEVVADAAPQNESVQINWDDFDLPSDIAHLYPRSQVLPTPEGPKFVVRLSVFEWESAAYSKMGPIISDRVNGPEQWKVAQIQPNGSGMCATMFMREIQVVLPDPKPLKDSADLPERPKDEELAATENRAIDWIKEEGATVQDLDDDVVNVGEISDVAKEIAQAVADAPDGGVLPDGA